MQAIKFILHNVRRSLRGKEKGQALTEYSFMWSFVGGAMVLGVYLFTSNLNAYFDTQTEELYATATRQAAEIYDLPECEPGKGNNGHGNNEDGVDSSNPGQGNGGPNGGEDPSDGVDDEIKGNQSSEDCDESNGNNGTGNNGHGNNDDGVDVSNPGQGNGGPNGEEDPSGEIDDESGNGNDGSNGNGKGKDK